MIDTAALREKVLDLAIRGKLVPQDPNDEPASVLLERIRAQKLQMVKEGKLKAKDIKDDTIIFKGDDNCHYEKFADGTIKNIQEEIPFELPDGWAWGRGTHCFQEMRSKKPSGEDFEYIDIDAIDNKRNIINETKKLKVKNAPSRASRYVEYGSVLFSLVRPYLKNIAFVEEKHAKSIASTGFFICTSTGVLYPKYLFFLMISQYVVMGINQYMKGDNSPSVSKNDIENWLYPIPPYKEQLRIVETLNELFLIIQEMKVLQDGLQFDIKTVKSKILELAIQGKLVEQDENDEPASVLLERIRAEKKAQLGKKYVESYIYKGDDNCYYENNDENPIETPFILPKNWEFSRLFNLAWLEDGEKSKGESLPYLDAKSLRGKQELVFINEGKIVEAGTNVILVDGENSGEVFEVPYRGYMGSTFKVLRVSKHIEKDFVKIILDFYKNLFKDNKTGSAIPHLNKMIFKSLVVGLPPVNEQKIIISKVKSVIEILKDEG